MASPAYSYIFLYPDHHLILNFLDMNDYRPTICGKSQDFRDQFATVEEYQKVSRETGNQYRRALHGSSNRPKAPYNASTRRVNMPRFFGTDDHEDRPPIRNISNTTYSSGPIRDFREQFASVDEFNAHMRQRKTNTPSLIPRRTDSAKAQSKVNKPIQNRPRVNSGQSGMF